MKNVEPFEMPCIEYPGEYDHNTLEVENDMTELTLEQLEADDLVLMVRESARAGGTTIEYTVGRVVKEPGSHGELNLWSSWKETIYNHKVVRESFAFSSRIDCEKFGPHSETLRFFKIGTWSKGTALRCATEKASTILGSGVIPRLKKGGL